MSDPNNKSSNKFCCVACNYQIPRGLQVDEVIQLGVGEARKTKQMEVLEEGK